MPIVLTFLTYDRRNDMKDLEKIKSEDLGCQVADANPGNFAIEQEVAQLVGATVPAPTEPSADDARELGAQLLVFLRRALLPIRSALRTAVAAIYAHLDSRCTAYTPAAYAPYQPLPSYDPMGTPPTPRTLPNLLTALTAFSARKISNGSAPSDGIPDGTSLAHLLLNAETAAAVLEIADDNKGYTINRSFNYTAFPNARRFKLAASKIIGQFRLFNVVEHLEADELEYIGMPEGTTYGYYPQETFLASEIDDETVTIPKLKTVYNGAGSGNPALGNLPNCKTLNLPSLHNVKTNGSGRLGPNTGSTRLANAPECLVCITNIGGDTNRNNASAGYIFLNAPKLQRFVLGGVLTTNNDKGLFNTTSEDLIYIELGGATCSLYMNDWNPTNALRSDVNDLVPSGSTCQTNLQQFLQNFKNHIALRLTSNGSGKTLTLSQAVRDAIHAAEATYGIEAIIVTQKGWTLSPAPGASSQ